MARQGDALRPATEQLFHAAGIGPGMRVLDCGSGGGDVSILAGELVTPSGQVLGIDCDTCQVDAANRRVHDMKLAHVRFETADIASPPDGPFDAIVGRLVLMYQPDVEAVLRALAQRLCPGGVMAFIEFEHVPAAEGIMWPRSPSADQVVRWLAAAFEKLGNQERMGSRLPSLLRSIGMQPQPPYELTGAVYTGAGVLDNATSMVRGLAPVLAAHGIAGQDELDVDAFAEQLRAEIGSEPDAVMVGGPHLAVWARKF